MPRLPRAIQPGLVYHLISRFVDRDWYITDETERDFYRWLLGRALAESDWRCLGYGIMSNHVHLGVVGGSQPLDEWVRRVHAPFADRMNIRHDRIGVMFVRGPKAIPIPDDEVADLIAYIHNNPVRANVVATPADSTWTSHRAYLGMDPAPTWLHVDEGLARAGFADAAELDRYVAVTPAAGLAAKRTIGRRNAVAVSPHEPGVDVAREVVATTAAELGVPVSQVRSRRRGSVEVIAREVVVHAAKALGLTGADIAHELGISQQRVSAISRRDVRDEVRLASTRVLQRIRRCA